MGSTSIGWTGGPNGEPGYTLNPWRGCTKATWEDSDGKMHLHTGCLNCYAEVDMSVKLHGIHWGKGQKRVPKAESGWRDPMRWARAAAKAGQRRKVFTASLADVLDSEVPDSMREPLWTAIEDTAWVCGGCGRPCAHSSDHAHRTARLAELAVKGAACEGTAGRCVNTPMGGLDFLLLTKRPENWPKVPAWLRALIWLGTSISDQETAEVWVPRLLESQGFRYRFLSVEPLVGPVDLSEWIGWHELDCGANTADGSCACPRACDWVICGGESGPKARPCNVDWIRSVVRQCAEAGVPCFTKQLGARPVGTWGPGKVPPLSDHPARRGEWVLPDDKGEDWSAWPPDLRVRQWPGVSP